MRNNNKKRKLKFIREKNSLRLCNTSFYSVFKISNRLINNTNIINILVSGFIEKSKKELFKEFRLLSLNNVTLHFAQINNDFCLNTTTLRIKLSKKPPTY